MRKIGKYGFGMLAGIPVLLFLYLALTSFRGGGYDSVRALNNVIDQIIMEEDMLHAQFGFRLEELETGKLMVEYNSNKTMIPASNMKIVTTGAALGILGTDHRFKTKLQYSGEITSGVLNGDIYVKGGGDPTLGSNHDIARMDMDELLRDMVRAIKSAGIKEIKGKIIADATIFETQMLHSNWDWEDIGNYYGAGVCGLSVNDNQYRLYLSSGRYEGDETTVLKTDPRIPDLEFYNDVLSGPKGSGDNAYIFGGSYDNVRFLRGTIPPGRRSFSIRGAIPDPPHFMAYSLDKKLNFEGIKTEGSPTTIRRSRKDGQPYTMERKDIKTYESPTIGQIVQVINQESNNLFADHLLKYMGYKQKGKGTFDAGVDAVMGYWRSKGLDTRGMFMDDGSGLSRNNGIVPSQMTGMLNIIAKQSYFEEFKSSLAICGETGTMSTMCRNTAAEGRVLGKSGTISRVRAYSGYFQSTKGTWYSYSMMANHFTGRSSEMRKRFERLMVKMVVL